MWRKKRSQSQVNAVWKKEFKIECLFNHTLKRIPFQRCPEIKYSLPLGFERSRINVWQSPKRMRSVLKKPRLRLYLYLFNYTHWMPSQSHIEKLGNSLGQSRWEGTMDHRKIEREKENTNVGEPWWSTFLQKKTEFDILRPAKILRKMMWQNFL